MLGAVLRSMRPHQWVKNFFVLAPLIFADYAASSPHLLRAAAAFALFSLLSGCVYLLNDLMDIEGDRAHPTKRERPIAAGLLPVPAARLALATILLGTIALALLLDLRFAAIALAYFTLNVGYSMALKHVVFIDVLCIAAGFVLRIEGGATAIDVFVSPWLLLCTFLLASFVGLGKRRHELVATNDGDAGRQRRVLEHYSLEWVDIGMIVLALLTGAAYTAYTLFAENLSAFSPRDLIWTLPFVFFGLWRFRLLTGRADDARNPTDLMLTDIPFIANLALWSVAVISIIYLL